MSICSQIGTIKYGKDFSLAQTGFLYGTGHYSRVAPLAQTWITGLLAYNKPKRQGRQGGPFGRNDMAA